MIPVRNIYYMLSYAFQALREQNLRDADIELFDNVQELLTEILIRGVKLQVKRGLGHEYIPYVETIAAVKGKIDVSETIKTRSILRRQVVCNYDDFSCDTKLNRIIKATLTTALRMNILPSQKKEVRKLLVFFADVSLINPEDINWNLEYNRINQSYQLLVIISKLLIKGYIQTQSEGKTRVQDFIDEQRMSRLYEKFILEYYKKHYPILSPSASQIKWQLDSGNADLLPAMKTDIMLQNKRSDLIIDAKYYTHTTQIQFDKHTVHSGNLYQIFTYVKNKEFELRETNHEPVSGILLYAKTDEEILPNEDYVMSGNRISVRTLDLFCDFESIAAQLNRLVDSIARLEF